MLRNLDVRVGSALNNPSNKREGNCTAVEVSSLLKTPNTNKPIVKVRGKGQCGIGEPFEVFDHCFALLVTKHFPLRSSALPAH